MGARLVSRPARGTEQSARDALALTPEAAYPMRIYAVIVLVRSMPRNLWAPLLRQRESRWLTIELGLGVVVMVVMGPTALGAPVNFWVLLGALGVTVIVSWVAPRFDKNS